LLRLVSILAVSAFMFTVGAGVAFADATPGVRFKAFAEAEEPVEQGQPVEHGLTGDISEVTESSVRLSGEVNPENGPSETHWEFQYATSLKGPWTAVPSGSGTLPGSDGDWHRVGPIELTGLAPKTAYFARIVATNGGGANENIYPYGLLEQGKFATSGSPEVSTFAVHALTGGNGEVRVMGDMNPEGRPTQYFFEYVTQEQYEAAAFTGAGKSSVVDVPASPEVGETGAYREDGERSQAVGEDLPGLSPGVSYRYRLVATNAGEGVSGVLEGGVSDGAVAAVTAPAVPSSVGTSVCPNEALRYGASGALPDCRAYEQVTPAEKKGTMDIYRYGLIFEQAQVGEDGEHLELHTAGVEWGENPNSVESNYLFSRGASGWQMTSTTPPQAGIDRYAPNVFNADLTQDGFEVSWLTSPVVRSPVIEYKVGPPGGPYVTAAVVPRADADKNGDGWVGESADGKKLILAVEDHTLAGYQTTTTKGEDLYEYSEGKLTQVNVEGGSPGTPISSCGATIATKENKAGNDYAVSTDGRRVFFTDNCTGDLYMRENGSKTVDIGPYRFKQDNSTGTRLLLEKQSGETQEFYVYDTESQEAMLVLTTHQSRGTSVAVSEDFSTLYIVSYEKLTPEAPTPPSPSQESEQGYTGQDIYRDEIGVGANHSIKYIAQVNSSSDMLVSRDGRFLYLESSGVAGYGHIGGFYRYDSQENVVECVTCASSFAPEAYVPGGGIPSENGDYIFFDTTAALVPSDVDGEVGPEPITFGSAEWSEHPSDRYSVSSDVYEWRREGLDGCAQAQGCLSLITSGRGGFKNVLLGISPSGRDVFFATHEALVAQDDDLAGDIYDARIGGGYPPPPPRPVECEGDACESPVGAPIDQTPASLAFSGPGNALPAVTSSPKLKKKKLKKKVKACGKDAVRRKGKCVRARGAGKRGRKSALGVVVRGKGAGK
jgi:hypothetical protein